MSIVASQLIWLLRTRGIRKRAMEAGKAFEDFSEAIEWQSRGIDIEKTITTLFTKKSSADKKLEKTSGNTSTVTVAPSVFPEPSGNRNNVGDSIV
jgi:hypothetical protein